MIGIRFLVDMAPWRAGDVVPLPDATAEGVIARGEGERVALPAAPHAVEAAPAARPASPVSPAVTTDAAAETDDPARRRPKTTYKTKGS